MNVSVKVNITIDDGTRISTSSILGPPEESQESQLDKFLAGLVWPYSCSNDGAVLSMLSSPSDLSSVTR